MRLLGLLVGIAVAVISAGPAVAKAGDAPTPPICHRVETLKQDGFAKFETVMYDFKNGDATKLETEIAFVTRGPNYLVSLIRLVIVVGRGDYFFFAYGPNGCYLVNYPMSEEQAEDVFDRARILAPFGSTYFQLPQGGLGPL